MTEPFPFHATPYTPEEARARREAAVARAKAETGIDEALIDQLVERFYDKVRADDLLAPVFAAQIDDWGPHLAQMKLFWGSVALSTGLYNGRPMPKHMRLPVDAEHFDRWLALFEATARELLSPAGAEHVMVRARRIAESLELGVANANNVMLGVGERYRR
ncbi:group III truncated hemoglobin [Caulobacter mirabilis]|uniref:group III truncated hemoglobin n=1 Tax=Caulobacter mirabilis TaxID=69666 RepID=UPI001FE95A1A|nr:group III truncated hemoglobin [Caulobacter mirabilis]